MGTLDYKVGVLLLSILVGMSFVTALSIGNSIHINITIDNSTSPDNSSQNQTNPLVINDNSTTNQSQTTASTSTTITPTTSSNGDTNSNTITDNSGTDDTSDGVQNQGPQVSNQDNSDNQVTGASVSANSGVLNKLKIGLSISTIILAAFFVTALVFYKRKIDEDNEIIDNEINRKVKKRKRKTKNR